MEEEIRNNKEAMDNVTKICCSIVEMLDYMIEVTCDKYSKRAEVFNKLDESVVNLLLNIDLFGSTCVSGAVYESKLDIMIFVFNETKYVLNHYIREEMHEDVSDSDEYNILIDVIKGEIGIIDIIELNKDKIIKYSKVIKENECGPLLTIEGKTTFNPEFNATNENISAIINMYYFVQELCNNEKQIQDLLDRL